MTVLMGRGSSTPSVASSHTGRIEKHRWRLGFTLNAQVRRLRDVDDVSFTFALDASGGADSPQRVPILDSQTKSLSAGRGDSDADAF